MIRAMRSGGNYTLMTIRGIRIGVDWSWFLVLFLIIIFLSDYYRQLLETPEGSIEPTVLGVASAFLFFGSILLHELGHAFTALRNGIGITSITLWMFGGIAVLDRDSRTPGEEFRIAAAGPAVTLLIAIACLGVGIAIDGSSFWDAVLLDSDAGVTGAGSLLAWLAVTNVLLFVFNLLPAFPLDGGRIARAIAWRISGDREQATSFAGRLGQGFSFVFVALGVFLLIQGVVFTGIWLAVIGWMLGQSARATVIRSELLRRVGGLSVADVMDAEPVAIPADASVERALDEYFLRYQWPWFPVVDAAQGLLGLVNRGSADAVPEVNRATETVTGLLDAATQTSQRIRDDAPLESLLGNAELRRLGGLPAVDENGRLSGVITLDQVSRALREAVGQVTPKNPADGTAP